MMLLNLEKEYLPKIDDLINIFLFVRFCVYVCLFAAARTVVPVMRYMFLAKDLLLIMPVKC